MLQAILIMTPSIIMFIVYPAIKRYLRRRRSLKKRLHIALRERDEARQEAADWRTEATGIAEDSWWHSFEWETKK